MASFITPTEEASEDDNISIGMRRTVSRCQTSENNETRTSEEDKKIYLSISLTGNKLGVAYYELDTTILYVMADIIETSDYFYTKQLLTDVRPNVVITSAKLKDDFLQLLKNASLPEIEDCDYAFETLDILPSNVFAYEMSKRRILALNSLPGLSKDADDDQRSIFFNSLLSFENVCMVCASGGLLKYLDQTRTGIQLEEVGTAVPVLMIKSFSLENLMMIDDQTFSALQIFTKEAHPSVYKSGGSGSKEGLSLFGIMNRTKSQAGFRLLRSWFLRPLTNIKLLNERLMAVEYFANSRNIEALMSLQDGLKSIKNLMRILSKMRSAGASLPDWKNVYKTIFNAICIGDICKGLPQDIQIIKEISAGFSKELFHMANLIKTIVDFEESSNVNHFVVKEGVDDELDEKKRKFDGIPYLMTQVAREELNKLDRSINKCSVTYLPQLGYLLNIPLTEEMKVSDNYNVDEGLEFKFVADDLVYYKSAATSELDDKLGDIQCDIRDHELSIMHRLQDAILEHTYLLNDVVELSAHLDCILALASSAKEYTYTSPTLLDASENRIEIIGGRHPLQELCVPQFIVNDTFINTDKGRVKLLTGPNASGKSVYLKQVGLIVYLAHIGSFVPAESAVVSIIDGIFTRIRTMETISIPLSTFMIDLNQIANGVLNATKSSLVIIDEFGKGTTSSDGLALLYAVINYWLEKEQDCPNILVSTHFHQIKLMLKESDQLKYQTMDVLCTDDDLVFLHQLKDGFADYSYACHTAKLSGIPNDILQRASEITSCIRNDHPIKQKDGLDDSAVFERYESIVEEFLHLDLENDDVDDFLKRIAQPLSTS